MLLQKSNFRIWTCTLAAALCLACAPLSFAQEIDRDDVIKVNTDLVVLDAQVVDKKTGKPFATLRKEDFELFEENIRQQIAYFSQDQLPLSILLLLDVSRSVRPIIGEIGEGANNALRQLKPEDEVAVMAFADYPKLMQSFTRDRRQVTEKIFAASESEELGNATMLNEALYEAAQEMTRATNPANRRAIIVVTDNLALPYGTYDVREVMRELFESGTVVYGLRVRAAFAKVFNVLTFGKIKGVDTFVEETGGELLGADRSEVDSKLGEMF